MINYSEDISEFTKVEFEDEKVNITDDSGNRVNLSYEEFDSIIQYYDAYKAMKEIQDGL